MAEKIDYRSALSQAREWDSLPKEDYRIEVNVKTGAVRFLPQPVDSEGIPVFNGKFRDTGWLGAYVQDDEHLQGVVTALEKKLRKIR